MSLSTPLDPVQLTRRLIDIESTTYGEGAVGAYLAELLDERGFAVERMHVAHKGEDGASTDRFNVFAGTAGETPELVLSTHMDTVPPFFASSEDDETIYGRGACDAKGIIVAQIAAAERLRAGGVKAGLLFLVGEERDSLGAKVANEQPKGSRYLINGEPTDNRLGIASKGVLRAAVRASGKMAHSAYPELGESAIDKLVEALHDVLAMPLPIEPEIGPATLNIGLISGGRAPNVVPDKAEAHILVRTVGPSEDVKEEITRVVAGRCDVAFSLDLPCVRMRRVGNLPTMVAKFATDIPSLTNWGEPFLLGPGSIHVAHTPDERISKKELLKCVDLYVELATGLVSV
jgi:acetylornithine deacetylase